MASRLLSLAEKEGKADVVQNHAATGDPGIQPISPKTTKNKPVILGPSDPSSVCDSL